MNQEYSRKTYYLLSLGCPKNLVDSEKMAIMLQRYGYRATADPHEAGVLVVNTGGFLAAAKQESVEALAHLASGKQPGQLLIAAGCFAQRDPAEIINAVPGVDGILGTRRWQEIVVLLRKLQRRKRHFRRLPLLGDSERPEPAPARLPVQSGSAYLKISDGCNARCAFCTIPSFKGRLRSRPMRLVLQEAEQLQQNGARELVIIAQDTTDYGRDWGKPNSLPRLLRAMCRRVPELPWIRLLYAYPGHVSPELIQAMAEEPQILPYLDIPLQHADPDVLRRMRRPSNIEQTKKLLASLREQMPDIALRTTFIVGYPGETEAAFTALLDFMLEIRFDKVGAFTFSPEPGTPAATLPDQIPEALKEERYQRLMTWQQTISLQRNQRFVGQEMTILVDHSEEETTLARSYRDAPEIDGWVILPGVWPAGTMLSARIVQAQTYDLIGEVICADETCVNGLMR